MRTASRRAITLVEAAVIAVIILFLLALLLPSLGGSGMSPRTACLANQSIILKGLLVYSAEFNGSFPCWDDPHHGAQPAYGVGFSTFGKGRNWDGRPGSVNDPGGDPHSNTRNLWTLVRLRLADPRNFLCQSDPDAGEASNTSDLQHTYDFQNRSEISYSFQYQGRALDPEGNPREGWTTTRQDEPRLVVLADRSPMLRARDDETGARSPGNGCWAEIATANNFGKRFVEVLKNGINIRIDATTGSPVLAPHSGRDIQPLNSPNHKGEGQNVTRLDGSGTFAENPWQGAARDLIWTVQDPVGIVQQDNLSCLNARARGLFDASESDMLKAWVANRQASTVSYPDSFLVP